MSEPQAIVLYLESAGDPSVGIPRFHDKITLTMEHGGWDAHFIKDATENLKLWAVDMFCDGAGEAYTESEYKAVIERHNKLGEEA